jgi:hypothetical protein
MKKLIIVCAALLLASPAWAAFDFSNSDWTQPYTTDSWTLGLYHFNEQAGDTTFADSSGNGHHGALPPKGSMVHSLLGGGEDYTPNPDLTWQPGKFDNALTLWITNQSDSNPGCVEIDQTGDTTNTSLVLSEGMTIDGTPRDRRSWTLEWWMKADDGGGSWGTNMIKKASGDDYAINYDRPGTLGLQYWGVGAWRNLYDTFQIPIGEWHHVAVVVNRHQVPFQSEIGWIHDGVLTKRETTFFTIDGSPTDGTLQFGNDGLWAGAWWSPNQYNGQLDEVRVSNVDRYGVPEPTTMSLVAIGLAGLLFRGKK